MPTFLLLTADACATICRAHPPIRAVEGLQPAGAQCNPRAKMTPPNLDGLAPPEVTEMYPCDHDIGSIVANVEDDADRDAETGLHLHVRRRQLQPVVRGLMQLRVLTGGRLVAKVAAALALVFGAAPATTVAQETRTAYAAMVFSAEGRPVPTTACLEVIERVYPSTPWWEAAVAEGSSAERAFKAVIGAIKRKSRAALLELTDPAQAKDTAEFDRQASAFFAQLQTIPLLAVPRAYEFDGLLVFFGTLKFLSETAIVPFVFAHQGNDRFGFLPSRTKGLTFRLVEDWFTGTAAPGKEAPAYCDEAAVKRATHRVSLVGASWRPSTLLLTGAPLAEPGALSGVAARVKSTVDAMKAALRGPDVSALAAHLTAFGADRLKRWLETAPAAEIEGYKTALIEQQPFFVFDASPLIVVYTKTKAGQNQVMYFTPAADQRLLWTNSSYLTVIDQVFKQGRLMAAAGGEPPFSELARK